MTDSPDNRRNGSATSGDVAIIGMACTFPRARHLPQFWQNIVDGVDAIEEVSPGRWDPEVFYDPDPETEDRVYCKRGGWLPNSFHFNPLKYGTMPRAVDGAEPDQFLVLRAVYEAMEDAGYLERELNGPRASFILGRGNYLGAGTSNLVQRGMFTEQMLKIIRQLHPEYNLAQLHELKTALRAKLPSFGAENAPGLIPNLSTGRVANRLDFMGANFTVDAACASSLIATELGVQGLASGKDDFVLAGGAHIFSDMPLLQVFDAMRALSHTSTIRPFDRDCDGTLAGEGVGILVLKRLEDAERDSDRIYAVIKGVGSSSDGRAKSVTAPRVEGEELALRRAYEASGVAPETIGLIEAHGTGTPVGDAAEVEALHRVLGPRLSGGPPDCAIGSVKSMIGHTMPAAGSAGLIKTALALYHRILPPTLNCRQPAEAITGETSRLYVNSETRPWINGGHNGPRRAGVNAFGFGGINAHVVLEEYTGPRSDEAITVKEAEQPTLIREWESELFVIEGETRQDLLAAVARLQAYASAADRVAPRDLAFTLNTALRGAGFRVAVVASSLPDLAMKLEHVAGRLSDPQCKQIKDSRGIFYFEESGARGGKLALLFPGEGSQYVNMLADLCIHFPQVRECFDAADRAVDKRYPPSADIFPPPFFSDGEAQAAEARLWKIERATEAVLTADGAMYTLLKEFGVEADMIAGHSAGEWVAMAASGILDSDQLVSSMGRLDAMYRKLAEDTAIPNAAMLAVGAGREKVEHLLAEIGRSVYTANDNCPHQVVVVVEPKDVDAVTKHLQSRGVFVEKLPHDRGYHTPVFTYICGPLREYFSGLTIRRPHTEAYCCTTAKPFPTEPAEILDLAANTFARPLLFREMIEAMYEAGARVFLEAGPRANLTAFVDDILRGRPHLAVAMDHYRKPGLTALHHALGMLAALNTPLNLRPLYSRRSPRVLTFDAASDQPEDEAAVPGTLDVSICFRMIEMNEPPSFVRAAASAKAAAETPEITNTNAEELITKAPPRVEPEVHQPAPVRREPRHDEPAAAHVTEREVVAEHATVAEYQGVTFSEEVRNPMPARPDSSAEILSSHFQVMEQFLQTQEDVMRAYLGRRVVTTNGQAHAPLIPEHAGDRGTDVIHLPPVQPRPAAENGAGNGSENGAGNNHIQREEPQPATEAAPTGFQIALREPSNPEALVVGAGVTRTLETAAATATAKEVVRTISLKDVLLNIVGEKTGYPLEMLGLDLDMEADLGIDSIKRIEILSALQEAGQSSGWSADADIEEVAKLKTLRQVIEFLERSDRSSTSGGPLLIEAAANSDAGALLAFPGEILRHTPGQDVLFLYELDLNEDLFLNDHCFDPPVSEWDHERGSLSFVPMTVSLEMMAQVATLLMPGLKVVGAKGLQALKWIDVEKEKPKVVLAIAAVRTSPSDVRVIIRHHQAEPSAGVGAPETLAEATIVFAKEFPDAPPIKALELKNGRPPACTAAELYSNRRMFHGPRFQGIVAFDRIGDDGLLAQLEVLPTNNLFRSNASPKFHIDPFLLDAAGQLVGYWPVECLSEGFVLFPIRIKELTLYQENLRPGQRAICQLRISDVTQRQLRAEIDVIGPDGRLWMRIAGWEDWRFYWPRSFYDFWRFPNRSTVSQTVEMPGLGGDSDVECRRIEPFGEIGKGMWENLWAHLILSRRELAEYRTMSNPLPRAQWIFGRAIAKDAVRVWVKRHYGLDLYPADVEIVPDENGKPQVDDRWLNKLGVPPPRVSISHKGTVAVAAAAAHDLGIDIEAVEPRGDAFETVAFDEGERRVLGGFSGPHRDEWVTRAWCAKEAAGKVTGFGLNGNPRSLIVESIDPGEGRIVVSRAKPALSETGERFVVESIRDGDFVIALAVKERNDDARD